MDSLAITDHGVMYGVIDFYRACNGRRASGPFMGCEVYVAPGSRFDEGRSETARISITIWCFWQRIIQGTTT